MNRKEWKELCKVDRAKGYHWYNKVTKKRLSKEFESLENCDIDAKVIHHLRDTEEQRKYNDEHYELFGFEIDENGNEHFEYGKYVVFWTKEHHTEYHRRGVGLSEETRKQISESVSNLWKSEDYRERQSKATKEAMWRPDVRQRLLDGCKKRPPISKEARRNAAESNRGKKLSEETRKILSEQKKLYYNAIRYNKFEICYKTDDLLVLHMRSVVCGISDEDIVKFISYFCTTIQPNKRYSTSDMASLFHLYKQHNKISWNAFQCAFNELRTAITLREIYDHK